MRLRHPDNSNLVLHHADHWRDLPVITHRGALVANYLEAIHETLCCAVEEYSRTCAIRFDLHIPFAWSAVDSAVISRFLRFFKQQIKADIARKLNAGKRAHPCRVRFAWAKERNRSHHDHYHVAILLNRDAYFTLGRFKGAEQVFPYQALGVSDVSARVNMWERIHRAWARALGCAFHEAIGLVHFPPKAVSKIDVNSPDYYKQFSELFSRISYFAKAETKHYGDFDNSFGCSRG